MVSRTPETYTHLPSHKALWRQSGGAFLNSPNAASKPNSSAGEHLPRFRRASEIAPKVVLTGRDLRILEDVWRFGLLTTSQIETLRQADPTPAFRFPSRLTLTRRLKLLFHHRYLRRLVRPVAAGSLEPIYVLDHGGARVLSLSHGQVSARAPSRLPKAPALDHLLETVQVRVAFTAASVGGDLELVEWLPGEKVRFRVPVELAGQRRQAVSIVPDAGIVVRVGSFRHYAFLEVDRGTEAGRVLAAKGLAYGAYWRSGGFARDFNVPLEMGFRVLLVAPTSARCQAILRALGALGELRVMFRVALAADITPDRIGQTIWLDGLTGEPCSLTASGPG